MHRLVDYISIMETSSRLLKANCKKERMLVRQAERWKRHRVATAGEQGDGVRISKGTYSLCAPSHAILTRCTTWKYLRASLELRAADRHLALTPSVNFRAPSLRNAPSLKLFRPAEMLENCLHYLRRPMRNMFSKTSKGVKYRNQI